MTRVTALLASLLLLAACQPVTTPSSKPSQSSDPLAAADAKLFSGDYDGAETDYKKLVDGGDRSAQAHYALLLDYENRFGEAVAQARAASAASPGSVSLARLTRALDWSEDIAGALDAGPQTILFHLPEHFQQLPSAATIWRILKRQGLVIPQPHKRPKASFVRFEAQLPNETWQCDATQWQLADGSQVEILNFEDDHSRLFLNSTAYPTVKAANVVESFLSAADAYGFPASLLSDNAAVFSGSSRRGKVALELELESRGIEVKHSTPYHPQTCGKVERLHQTLKLFLAKQAPATSLAVLQAQLDAFRTYYNQRRPHRALGRQTPLAVFNAKLKARPQPPDQPTHYRVRQDRIDSHGSVTLRYLGRLRHIRVGAVHRNRRVHLLVAGADVRVLTTGGELLRELRLEADRLYFGLGGRWPVHNVLRQVSSMS